MTSHRGLVGILLVMLASGGCVVYRDRVLAVGTQTQVAMEPTVGQPPPSAPQTAALPPIPQAPPVLDAPTMHAALDSYGSWVDNADYGEVWVPEVDPGFVPYGTNGQWEDTSAGWYWDSGYDWGAVAFHYGRWVQSEDEWAWVPGAMFAPAWVDWRYGSGWVGWSPLGPIGMDYAAPYAYCPSMALSGPGVWGRTVYGSAASSLYPLTQSVPASYGYGGSQYAWGPPVTVTGVPAGGGATPIERAWSASPGAVSLSGPRSGTPVSGGAMSLSGPRAGAPVSGGGGPVVGHPGGSGPGLSGQPFAAGVTYGGNGAVRPGTAIAPGAFQRPGSVPFVTAFGPPRPSGRLGPAVMPQGPLRNSITLGNSGGYPVGRMATWDRFNAAAPHTAPSFGGGSPSYTGGHFGSFAPTSAGMSSYRPASASMVPGVSYGRPGFAAPNYAPARPSFGGGGFGGPAAYHPASFGGGGFSSGFHGGGGSFGRGGRR